MAWASPRTLERRLGRRVLNLETEGKAPAWCSRDVAQADQLGTDIAMSLRVRQLA